MNLEARDFLSLCAIGSIIGIVMRVDMEKVRKNDLVHLLVGVLDIDAIPSSVEIVVGEYVYDIFSKLKLQRGMGWSKDFLGRRIMRGRTNQAEAKMSR